MLWFWFIGNAYAIAISIHEEDHQPSPSYKCHYFASFDKKTWFGQIFQGDEQGIENTDAPWTPEQDFLYARMSRVEFGTTHNVSF